MQTITTKYLAPTNHNGSRFKATHTGNATSVTIPYDYSMSADANHTRVAFMLAEKLNWEGDYIGGHTKDGMVFVNAKPNYSFHTKRRENKDFDFSVDIHPA